MKLIWEERDIKPGRVVTPIGSHPGGERWVIGYTPHPTEKKSNLFSLVSLADGAICLPNDAAHFVALLNEGGLWPVEWLK